MKARILLLAAGIATLTSCSSLYKTGQTPDDVYYSPARPSVAAAPRGSSDYVEVNQRKDGRYQSYEEYQDSYRNDRFLRMSIGNPYYLSAYNDYAWSDWRYNTYAYYGNSPWNNYWAWNNFYNPYSYSYCMVPIGYGYGYGGYSSGAYGGYDKISLNAPPSRPVAFSGASYNSGNRSPLRQYNGSYYNNSNGARQNNSYNSGSNYNNSNGGRYVPANNYNNNSSSSGSNQNSTYTPSRSYSPAPSSSGGSSSSGGGGGGGGGGISRPTRP